MLTETNLRNQILALAQGWPWMLVAFFVGSLLGWGISYVAPPTYTSETELYVAFNGDTVFTNPDDYKNWQMEQLDAFVVSDQVLQEVLVSLQEQGGDWGNLHINDLESMLSVHWRNAGKWRLMATANNSMKAEVLAQTWHDVVFQSLSEAVAHANQFLQIDRELNTITFLLAKAEERLSGLHKTGEALSAWRDEAQNRSPSATLGTLERWRLQSWAAWASSGEGTDDLFNPPLPPDTGIQDTLRWVDQVLILVENEQQRVEENVTRLQQQQADLNQRWVEEEAQSQGLSAYLHVETLNSRGIVTQPVRRPALFALAGGLFGLITWLLLNLARVSQRR